MNTMLTTNNSSYFASQEEVFAMLNEMDQKKLPTVLVEVTEEHLQAMTREEAGDCIVDLDTKELEAVMLMLSRLAGVPEPELYRDTSPYLFSGVDSDLLLQVVELQIRMATGMEMIEAASAKLEWFKNHRVPREVFMQWVDHRKKLWTCWHNLKGRCSALVGSDKAVWAAYFQLKDEVEEHLEDWYNEQLTVSVTEETEFAGVTFDAASTWDVYSRSSGDVIEDMLMNEIFIRGYEERDLQSWEDVNSPAASRVLNN